ncbi:MAG: 4-(cytidine 5'-diphospho)-2-C-methyl-D-erythritol kinase [Nitrospirae bacterium]|nr:4-(cytidine 5'-diphospho)-2-C-methyl-D-erythritol kinase [Nitrospirota bacterium]
MSFVLEAPAKINWFLSVLNKREDGYHNIVSLMQRVSLFDTLLFEESEQLEVITDIADLPAENNLVFKAAVLMRARAGVRAGARITLKKDIPLAAGMGGGSSDAAYTLIGLNRLWGLNLNTENLRHMGAELGSDVPFFIEDTFALVQGRGEVITSVRDASEIPLLLVNPGIPVSAAWAYAGLHIGLTKQPVDIKLFCQCLVRKDFVALRSLQNNDLELPVLKAYPEIGRIKELLLRQGAVISAMSGSGSTVFGVFRTEEDARNASKSMGGYWCRAVKTLTVKKN